jgi:DNA-binding transcriptional LysR family regulator
LVLSQVDHAGTVGERIRLGEEGQLFIGVAGPADADYFVEIMRAYALRHPHVRVSIRNLSTAEQVRAIQEKRLHAGFVTPPVDDPDLLFESVLHEPIVLAVPRGHALAARARVPLAALAERIAHPVFPDDGARASSTPSRAPAAQRDSA